MTRTAVQKFDVYKCSFYYSRQVECDGVENMIKEKKKKRKTMQQRWEFFLV